MTVAMVCKHGVMAPSQLFFLGSGYSHEPGRNPCQLKCMAAIGVSRSFGAEWGHNRKEFGKAALRV